MKTTSFETVAQPKSGEGSRRTQSARPVAASRATSRPFPLEGRRSSAPWRPWRSPPAQVDDGDEQPALRVGHRRQDSAEQAGADDHAAARQRAAVVAVQTDSRAQRRRRVSRSQAITARPCRLRGRARRPRPSPGSASPEVVVADVVRHLVVPEQPAAPRIEHEQRVRVRHRAGEGSAVRAPAIRPTAPGSSSRVEPAARRPRPGTRRPSPPASSGYRHGSRIVSNFQRTTPVAASSA